MWTSPVKFFAHCKFICSHAYSLFVTNCCQSLDEKWCAKIGNRIGLIHKSTPVLFYAIWNGLMAYIVLWCAYTVLVKRNRHDRRFGDWIRLEWIYRGLAPTKLHVKIAAKHLDPTAKSNHNKFIGLMLRFILKCTRTQTDQRKAYTSCVLTTKTDELQTYSAGKPLFSKPKSL